MHRTKVFGLLVAVIVLAFLASALYVAHSTSEVVAPWVVETTPALGEELPLTGAIRFQFDYPMDRTSVERAFAVDPPTKGSFTWADDLTVSFQPSEPLKRATEYMFSVDPAAVSASGGHLRDKYTLKLHTTGFLQVAQVMPENGTKDLATPPTITIIFNRPVVPLQQSSVLSKLPGFLTIVPEVEGEGSWLNTSIFTFKPAALRGGTTYTVTVNKGLTDITGTALQEDYVFTFSTLAPQALEIIPGNAALNIARDPKVQVAFSQPMDTTATETAFSLTGPDGVQVPGKFSWDDKHYKLIYEPLALLDYGTTYDVYIDRIKARSEGGGLIGKEAKSSFTTVSAPDIVGTNPNDGTTTDELGSFTVYFSSPANLQDFKGRISIDPRPRVADYGAEPDDKGFFYRLNFGAEPSTSYTLTIDTNGLLDRYGTPFKLNPNSKVYTVVGPGKIQVKYVTLAFPPSASLKTGSDVGLYSAYRPFTRVFTMHRNIQSVSMALWSMPVEDFLRTSGLDGQQLQDNYKHTDTDFLRRWTVPVFNPPNALRYDLLTISPRGASVGQKNNVICVDTLPTQLDIGQRVTVLKDDSDAYRLRDEAGMDGYILAQLKAGTELVIADGPICADKYVWWKLRSDDGTVGGWGVEGDRVHYFIGPTAADPTAMAATAQPTEATTPQAAVQAPQNAAQPSQLRPGIYWLDFSSPDLPDASRQMTHLMIVATANVTLKMTPTTALAWVTDLQSGLPVSDVSVQFYSGTEARKMGDPVKTDSDGLARFTLPDAADVLYHNLYAVVDDGGNFGVSMSRWSGGIAPGDFNQRYNYYPDNATVYLYTDRSLYRPGQKVYFRGILRTRNDLTYSMSDLKETRVTVYDPQGRSVYEKDVSIDSFGSFSDSFDLDPNAALGNFRIVAQPKIAKINGDDMVFEREISVAEYRVPEFQVQVTPDKAQVVQGDTARIKVNSTFFFGGPVSNAKIEWTVTTDNYFFNLGSGRYSFYDYDEDVSATAANPEYDHTIAKGQDKTDDLGNFTIEVPASLGKAGQSQTFTVEVHITDESDRLVAGSTQIVVNQGEFYIGAVAENYVGTAGESQNVDLVTVDWTGKPKPNIDLNVRAVERSWSSVQSVEPGTGRIVWEYQVKENPIADAVVHTDADGKAVFPFTPPRGGAYKVYATGRDVHGNQVTTSAFLWIAGTDYVPWRQQNSNRIDLKIDQDRYQVGDTASILIASPFQGQATALITVERGSILKTDVVTLPTNSTVYKLPITPDMAPNVYVSVMVMKGVDDTNPTAGFRMGLVQLNVSAEQLALKIAVTPDRQQAGPRDTVNYKIRVTNYAGEPVRAEIGVGLTDLAVLSLLPDTSTPILQHFYSQQSLSIRTATALTLSVDQQTQQILNVVKGGGGGGPEAGIFEVRQQFVDTPLWNPSIVTDDDGNAAVSVTLPDQLTTWRLDVRAVTQPTDQLKTTLVGQTTSDLISSKPLLIRPVTPRFYVAGDTGVLAAIVNNNTNQPLDVKVYINATGLIVQPIKASRSGDDTAFQATIPAQGRQRFEWPIEVQQDVDAVGVTFYAATTDNKYTDAAKSAAGQGDDKTLPVLHYRLPDMVSTAGLIGPAGGDVTEGISLPSQLQNANRGALMVKVDPSLAASATSALTVLQNYPYQCVEQTVSKFLPNIYAYRALSQLSAVPVSTTPTGVFPITAIPASATPAVAAPSDAKTELERAISYALQRLYNEQHTDGGWGWFVQEDSSTPTTAYALLGLIEATQEGFPVNQAVVNQATNFLRQRVGDMPDKPDFTRLNRQAFMLWVLARAKVGDPSRAVRLFDYRDRMGLYARAYLALTLHLTNAENGLYVDTLIKDLVNHAIVGPTGIHWEESGDDYLNWNTDVRSTAIILQALIELDPKNALIPDVVRWLLTARHGDAWDTTQETAWSVMALTNWMQISTELKPNYTFSASLNGNNLIQGKQVTPPSILESTSLRVVVADLLKGQVNRLTIERTPGDGMLYYTASLMAYPTIENIKAVNKGISIQRAYSMVTDKDRKPITEAHVGDVIRVTLDMVVPNDMFYAVITDPIPAGTEAVDPNLPTSGTIGKAPELHLTNPLSLGWGWWWFSKTELRDDRVVLYTSYLPKGTYQYTYTIRAGLAGQYRVIPATGAEFYTPVVYGRSDGSLFTILPAN